MQHVMPHLSIRGGLTHIGPMEHSERQGTDNKMSFVMSLTTRRWWVRSVQAIPQLSFSSGRERLIQIRDDVLRVLNADRKPHNVGTRVGLHLLGVRQLPMRR
jgi:hypothetical protein